MTTVAIVLLALLLDTWLGEPRRLHPLSGFGRLADQLERGFNRGSERLRVLLGGGAWLLAVLPLSLLGGWLAALPQLGLLVELLLLYLAIGPSSLAHHGRAVAAALVVEDLVTARQRVGWMVGRDVGHMDQAGVARAAVESVLENGNDALFGAIFWYLLLGAPGVILYRLANTLAVLWGERNERYRCFGLAAARSNELFNWLPARLTALSYALVGNFRSAVKGWRTRGQRTNSTYAELVMASGAGALGLALGGVAVDHGQGVALPLRAQGREPLASDIARAVGLLHHAQWLWVAVIVLGGLLFGR